jgi:hypothetical protein
LWLDRRELAEGGFTASDVAWFLKRYTQAENRSDPQRPPLPGRSEGVFAAAFPSTALYGPIACGSQDPVGK